MTGQIHRRRGAGIRRRAAAVFVALAATTGALQVTATAGASTVPHVFVFSGTYGFRHGAITHAKEVVQQMATATGAFTVEFSENAADFTPALYQRADVVHMLSSTGEYPLNSVQKTDLLRFFACGGGYVATHAASDANYSWPGMLELVGAWFDTHPNGWGNPAARMIVEDQTNPATAPWHGTESFMHADEFYRWRVDPRGTQDVQTLFSLDETSSGQGTSYVHHQPVAYSKTFRGLGRVINSNIGHDATVFDRPYWQQHHLGSLAWVTEKRVDRGCAAGGAGAVLEVSSAKVATVAAAAGGSGFGGSPVTYSLADTAVSVSKRLFPSAVRAVVVSAADYASGLAAAPLAAQLQAPLLVTASATLSPETEAEIARLGVDEVVIVGDTTAVSAAAATDLGNGTDDRAGLPVPTEPRPAACGAGVPSCNSIPILNDDVAVRRIAGADRNATAALVAAEFPSGSAALLVDATDAGAGAREALAATGQRLPILLTDRDSLPQATADALAGRAITIVGGLDAVSAAVEQAAAVRAASIRRTSGGSRSATSAILADDADAGTVWLASGADLPQHAMIAGAAAASEGGTLLLVDATDLTSAPGALGWLRSHAAEIGAARGVGPTAELGHRVLACAQQVLIAPAGVRTGCGA